MRFGRRTVIAMSALAAGALAFVGIALAATTSTSVFKFTPDKVPKRTYKAGKLFVHTHTNYHGVNGAATKRAQLSFDDDFRIRTKGIPTCRTSKVSSTITMQAAMAACGRAKVGSGKAEAAAGANTVHACVLAFNGKRSNRRPTLLLFTRANAAPPFTIDCSNPSSNTAGNTNVLLDGKYSTNPSSLGTDFANGKQLLFSGIHAASPLPLTDFNVTVGKPTVGNYVSARCHDGNHQWNLKTKFTYDTGTQTVSSSAACS